MSMSTVLDLLIPGSGMVVDVLTSMLQLSGEMKDSQDVCKRVHGRLKEIFDELANMQEKNQLPSNDAVERYKALVSQSLKCFERYREEKLWRRLINYQDMMEELCRINESIDELFQMLNLAGIGAMMNWKQQWEADQVKQQKLMASLVESDALVLRELQSARAQQEAMLNMQFQIKHRADRQGKEMLDLLKSLVGTVVRTSNASVPKPPSWFVPSNEVTYYKEPFARGSFGTVHRGEWGRGTPVVVKCFMVDGAEIDESSKQQIEAEINLWHSFGHPNVIKMFGASHVSAPPFIICEVATNGDLRSYLSRPGNKRHMWRLLFEAANGLDYIHRKGVVHGDLKLNNILVGADGNAKLSDFGLSAVRTSSSVSRTAGNASSGAGGLRWRAPECLKHKPTFASDVYSYAMCVIEAVIGNPPFSFLDDDTVRYNLEKGIIPEQPEGMSTEAWELVVSMTSLDPKKRVSLAHVIDKLESFAKGAKTANEVGGKCVACASQIPAGLSFCLSCGPQTPDAVMDQTVFSTSIPESVPKTVTNPIADLLDTITTTGDVLEKERLLLQLVQKCTDDQNRALMFDANGVQVLSSLIREGRTYFTRLYALQCLKWPALPDHKLSEEEYSKLRTCVQQTPQSEIALMSKALQKGSDQEKEEATIRCACMALVAPAVKLRDAGVIQPLVSFLRSGTDEQKLWAAEALGNLALENEAVRAEIGRKDAVKPLVALLTGPIEEHKSWSAYALGNLVLSKPTNDAIWELQEALPAFFTLFREGNLVQKGMATSVLMNLVRTKYPSHDDIKRETRILQLVAIVLVGTVEEQTAGLDALALLPKNHFPYLRSINDALAATLVMLMENGAYQQKLFSALALADISRQADIIRFDVDPLHADIVRFDCVRDQIAAPLVGLITDLLSNGSNDHKTAAAIRLETLAGHNEIRDEFVRQGSLVLFVTLFRTGNADSRAFALGELRKTHFDSIASTEFVREGGVEALMRCFAEKSGRVDDAVVVLAGLADSNDEVRAELARNGGVGYLLENLQNGTDQGKATGSILCALEKLTAKHGIASNTFPGALFSRLLRAGSDEQKLLAAGIIGNLVNDRHIRELVLRDDLIAALATLLVAENDELKEAGAAVLYLIFSSNDTARACNAAAGAVVPLVKLLCEGTGRQGACAADVLMLLASNDNVQRAPVVAPDPFSFGDAFGNNYNSNRDNYGNKKSLVRAAPFVGLLHHGTDQQKQHSAAILASLSRGHNQDRQQLIDDEAVAPLVALVREGTDVQKGYAAAALANLAFDALFGNAISHAGGVEALTSLVQTGMEENKIIASLGLGYLALNDDLFRERFLCDEELAPALELLQTGVELQQPYALADLRCLPLRETIGAEFQYGGAAPFVTLLYARATEKEENMELKNCNSFNRLPWELIDGTEEQKQNEAIVSGILATFNDAIRFERVENQTPFALVNLLRDGTTKQKRYASDALKVLSNGNDQTRDNFAPSIKELVALLRDGTDEQKESSSAVVANLARGADRIRVADCGVIAPLVALVENGTNAQKGYAALALANLALNDYIGTRIGQTGGIQALVSLLQTGTDAHKKIAAIALANIASNSLQLFDNISDTGGIVPLVALLRAGAVRVRGFAARKLKQITFTDASAAAFVNDGGLAPLMDLLQTGTDQEQEDAVHIMSKLNFDENVGAFIASRGARGAITSLVVLTRSGVDEQRKSAVIVLRKLAGINDALRTEILGEGGFTMLETLGLDGHENKQEDAIESPAIVVEDESNDRPTDQPSVTEHVSQPVMPDNSVQTEPQSGKQDDTVQIGPQGGKQDDHAESCGTSASTDIPTKKRLSSTNAESVLPAQSKADPPVNLPIIKSALTVETARAKGVPELMALLKTGTNEERDIAVRALEDLAFTSAESRGDIVRQGGVELLESIRRDGTDLQKQVAARALRQLNPDCCALM